MALGPGVQSYGPTEQLLKLVACDARSPQAGTGRYCSPRKTETRRNYEVLEELGIFPGQKSRVTRPTS